MIQRFISLPLALRVLILVIALGALLILATGIPTIATKTFERFSGFLAIEAPQQNTTQGDTSRENQYLTAIEDIQTKAVESFVDSDDRFSHYDSVTPDDVEKMKTNYDALGNYLSQVDSLDPPDSYKLQYELFRSAITELYQAAGLAYSLAADPGSLTKSSLDDYDLHVDKAASLLRQSNESLGQDYKTIEDGRSNPTSSSTTKTPR